MVTTTHQSGLLTWFLTPLMLCVLILYISGDLLFKVDSERQIFWETFHGRSSQSFWPKSAERKSPKKYFCILFWCLAWSSDPGLCVCMYRTVFCIRWDNGKLNVLQGKKLTLVVLLYTERFPPNNCTVAYNVNYIHLYSISIPLLPYVNLMHSISRCYILRREIISKIVLILFVIL